MAIYRRLDRNGLIIPKAKEKKKGYGNTMEMLRAWQETSTWLCYKYILKNTLPNHGTHQRANAYGSWSNYSVCPGKFSLLQKYRPHVVVWTFATHRSVNK